MSDGQARSVRVIVFGQKEPIIKVTHIDIISIPVQDQETAKRFHRDPLSFEIVRDKSNTLSAAGVGG